jgi:hypothetical protein
MVNEPERDGRDDGEAEEEWRGEASPVAEGGTWGARREVCPHCDETEYDAASGYCEACGYEGFE